jgi:copper homeostasis protein
VTQNVARDKPSVVVEAAVESLEGALAAERAGVDRIELCANLEVGGTTPNLSLIKKVKEHVRIPVHVMVRPRAGDFVYSDDEVDLMTDKIALIRAMKPAGIVTGALDRNGRVALSLSRLVRAAKDLPVTFHRAFDQIPDKSSALQQLIEIGVVRILTAGGTSSAIEGVETIAALVRRGVGRITILAGGGVRAHNVRELIDRAAVREIHARFEDEEQMQSLVNTARR